MFKGERFIVLQDFLGDQSMINYTEKLYYRLFYALYHRFMNNRKDVRHIFNELYIQWTTANEDGKMSLSFLLPISEYNMKNDLLFNKKFHLKMVNHSHWKKTVNGIFPDVIKNSKLLYNTKLSVRIFPSKKGNNLDYDKYDEEFQKEFSLKSNKLWLIACAFYLNNLDFRWKEILFVLPWWFEPDSTIYEKIERDPISLKYQKEVTKGTFKQTLETYQDLKSSDIFNKTYQHLADNYFRIFQNYSEDPASLSEFIVCSSVVLETIFTQGYRAELKFRFSLNSALFVSKKGEDLKENYNLLKFTYDLRSIIVHGDRKAKHTWYKKLIDFVERVENLGRLFEYMQRLKGIVNTCLNKLMMLKLDDPRIMNKIGNDPFFFINHSENYKKLF